MKWLNESVNKSKKLNIKNIAPSLFSVLSFFLSHLSITVIYKSTNNYVAAKNNPTPAINWVRQWRDLFQWFPDIQFIKVSEALDNRNKACQPYILEWKGMKNVSYMTLNELQSSIAKGADF